MEKSIDKEKSQAKTFSALDKIKKSKKIQNENIERKNIDIDSIFKVSEPIKEKVIEVKPVVLEDVIKVEENKVEEKSNTLFKEQEVEEIILEDSIFIEPSPKKDFSAGNKDIASMLKNKNHSSIENVVETKNIEENIYSEPQAIQTSASIAKERLKHEIISQKKDERFISSINVSQRKDTASDSLNKLFGAPEKEKEVLTTQFSKEESIPEKQAIFIPWENATPEEKSKARKIMSAGVAAGLMTLTFFTFH